MKSLLNWIRVVIPCHLLCSIFIWLLPAPCVFAQTKSTPPLPEALKGIQPATGVCRRDQPAASLGNNSSKPKHHSPDLTCAASLSQVLALADQPDTLLFDVRHSSDFMAFHIKGAMNKDLASLRTANFLGGKTVVLVGSGKAERDLYLACGDLKTSGAKRVFVLQGGIASWISGGNAVEGRVPSVDQLFRLTASELWAESQFNANLVLVHAAQEEIRPHLFASVPLRDISLPAIKSEIIKRRKNQQKNKLIGLVLVVPPNTSPEQLDTIRRAILPMPMLIFAEPAQVFIKEMTQQKNIWSAHARGPRKPGCGL